MFRRCIFMAALAAASGAHADEPTPLEPITVTATRGEHAGNPLPAALIVITREDIDNSGAQNIAEVLRARAGVEVIDFFGDGSSTLVGLRGFGENAHSNTLVLVDGRRLNNADIGSPDLATVDLDDVERIEIVQGSLGALYGDQAVGGVINIVTRGRGGTGAEAGVGSYGLAQLRARARGDAGPVALHVSGEGRHADNYRDNNVLTFDGATGGAEYRYGSGRIELELQGTHERLQEPGALFADEVAADRRQSAPDFAGDFSRENTRVARAAWQQVLTAHWSLDTDVSHRRSDGVFRLSFRGAPATGDSTQDRRVTSVAPRATGTYAFGPGTLSVIAGVDAQRSLYNLLSPIGPQSEDQREIDGYTQVIVPLWRGLDGEIGARVAHVRNDLSDNFVFPNGGTIADTAHAAALGFTWRPADALRVFTRYDQGFRFPKVDEYFGSTFTPGIVSLRTQTNRSWELGSEWRRERVRAALELYRLDVRDEIVFDPKSFVNENLDSTRRYGALLEGAAPLYGPVDVSASYAYVDAQVRSGVLAGDDVPLLARHVGRLGLDWPLAAAWNLHAEVEGASRRVLSGDFDNSLPRLPGYAVINAAARYKAGAWHAQVRLNNLLDRKYSQFGTKAFPPPSFAPTPAYFPSPGFNGWLGLGIDF